MSDDGTDQYRGALARLRLELYERALRRVFRERSELWESEMARLFSAACPAREPEWLTIGSLAALRKVCGGRFQILKRLWVEAGLPLRRHRGDRASAAEIAEPGWENLVEWLAEKGIEAKPAADGSEHLLEVRHRGKT